MALDFTTLLVCYALLRVLQAAGLVYVWRVRSKYAPLRDLSVGSVMVALGSLSVSNPMAAAPEIATVVQTVLIAGGVAVFNVGLVRLAARPAPWTLAAAWTAVFLLAKFAFVFVWPSDAAGVALATVFIVGCAGFAAVALFRTAAGPLRTTQRIIAALVLAQLAGAVQRGVALVGYGGIESGAGAGAVVVSTTAQSIFLVAAIAATFLLTVSIAVLANQRLQGALDVAAKVDPLTGLMNRRAFSEAADRDWAHSARGERLLSVMLLDLDNFKSFNDLYGHKAGDAVLREVGQALTREVRANDVVCRFGGEEFVVLMPDTSAAEAQSIAERLRTVIAALKVELAPDLSISTSIGVAERSRADTTWEQLVAASDKALYAAKRGGRNRVVVADVAREAA